MGIQELMNKFPATCGLNDTLREAARKMEGGNCESLPVTAGARSRRLVGMITDGDICMAVQLRGRNLQELRVRDAMAREVRVCGPEDSLFEAETIMREAVIRYLPVVGESGRLLGVLSVAAVAREAERERDAMRTRIAVGQLGLVVSGTREPFQVGNPTKVERPSQLLESSGERHAGAN